MDKDLYSFMELKGLLEFGSVITGDVVLKVLKVEYPKIGTREAFRDLDLFVLSAIDNVRQKLLNEGKYLAQSGGNYRILLPSENRSQCSKYIAAAQRKLKKSLRLSVNTPVGDYPSLHDMTARAHIKLDSIRL